MTDKKYKSQQRKDNILGIVVHEYVINVSPVSSAYLVDEYKLDLSSASVRNILAELEDEGYLTHPHTSAGRVPTQKGYRYYVDYLMQEIQLLDQERKIVEKQYRQGMQELEDLLSTTSEVVCDLTNYTSIISVDGWDHKIFCRGTSHVTTYPSTQNVEKIAHILKLLEEKEKILNLLNRRLRKKIDIYIGHELALEEMESCAIAISRFEKPGGPSGRIAVLGPDRMDYQRVVSTLDYISDIVSRTL